jgi:hypothetical protein
MLRDVSHPTRLVIASIVLVGAVSLASAAHATPVSHPAAVHPTSAASSTTRRVAHVTGARHAHHARIHHSEPNLRAHVVTAASLPARVPSRPRVPRSNHRAPATVYRHLDTGARTSGAAGMPVSAAGALSIAILGTCVHQRTRARLRSISEPLESRGPPRAGPSFATLASRPARGAREFTADASAPHPPLAGPRNSRVSPSPLRDAPHPAPAPAVPAPLECSFVARARDPRPARPAVPQLDSRCPGAPGPTWSARSRACALRCRPLEPEELR